MKSTLLMYGMAAAALSALGSPALAAPAGSHFQVSASALQQVQALEADADARTPIQQHISSQLLYTLRMARGEQIAPGIAQLRTGVQIDCAGLTLIDIDGAVTPDLLRAIVRVGGQVVHGSADFGQARARVPLASLETLASVPGVRFIKPAVLSQLNTQMRGKSISFLAPLTLPVPERVSLPQRKAALCAALPGVLKHIAVSMPGPVANTGSETSEGDKAHQADKARSTFGVDGTGIKVGVLSDSIDDAYGAYADAKSSGDVSSITVISGQAGEGEGEGLAMLEIVHDLAPGAQLYFATGVNGEASMADNIVALQKAGCNVIIDDIAYYDEPPFQDGVIAKAVNTVTAAGALYFSCAANYGNKYNYASSVWEGDFKDSGKSVSDGKLHDFSGLGDTGNEADISGDSAYISLFWADPLGKSSNDYDLFIFDASGDTVVASSTDRQTGSQDPFEIAQVRYGQHAAIVLHKGSARFLHLDIDSQNSLFGFNTTGRTRGHNAAANAFCVAATDATESYPDPFSKYNSVEGFSSDGPRRIFFNPDGSAITAGNFTHTGGTSLKKPDFTAADGVSTTLPYAQGLNPFYGTSAAAPHAGAIAALMLSKNKTLTRAQVSSILDSTAIDIETGGYDVTAGYGILNAYAAVQNTPSAAAPPTISSLSPSSANAGGPAFTLTVNGTNFISGSVVKWNGATETTTFASSTKLTASISASLIASAGTATVTVTTPHVGTSAGATFTINASTASAPVLSSISPTTRTAGGGAFVLTANGSNFISGSLIKWNGATQATTYVSSTKLTASIPASLIASAGTASITVTTPHVGTSGSKSLTITAASTVTAYKLAFSPASISSNGKTTGTVTLSGAAPSGGAAVNVSYQGSAVLTATVPAGSASTTFVLNFGVVTAKTVFQIDATYGGKTASANVAVNTTSVKPSKLSFSPSTVTGSSATTGTVTLTAAAPAGDAVVTITQDGTTLGTITVLAGNVSATFTYTPGPVSSQTTYTMGAVYNGKTVTANLTAKP